MKILMFIHTRKGAAFVSATKKNNKHLKLIKSYYTDEERFQMRLDSLMKEVFETNDLSYTALLLDEIYNYLADVAASNEGETYHEDLIVSCYKIKECGFYIANILE